MFAGVSGMRNHQVRMDVIGSNIANVNTVAFKSGRVTFKEGFAQLLQGASRPPGDQGGINPIQVGLGMQIGSIDQLFTQGNLETTGQNTDLAIQGDAMFVVRKGNQSFFTRSDNIQFARRGVIAHTVSSFGLHTDYHRVSDETKMVDYAHMTDAIRSMLDPIGWLANSSFTPEWLPGQRPQ